MTSLVYTWRPFISVKPIFTIDLATFRAGMARYGASFGPLNAKSREVMRTDATRSPNRRSGRSPSNNDGLNRCAPKTNPGQLFFNLTLGAKIEITNLRISACGADRHKLSHPVPLSQLRCLDDIIHIHFTELLCWDPAFLIVVPRRNTRCGRLRKLRCIDPVDPILPRWASTGDA